MKRARLLASLALVVATAACGPPKPPAPPPSAQFPAGGQAKCGVQKSQAHPLIVEWPSADRASLEAATKTGIVAVHYAGCEMEVLTNCRIAGSYTYTPVTAQHDHVAIKDADELYANVPLGAAKLEGKLAKSGELNVDMTIVGQFAADRTAISSADLQGDCKRATHFVRGLTAGAFKFYAGASQNASGEAGYAGVGAGASSKSQYEMLNGAGDDAKCQASTAQDQSPPFGCGALLRIEVYPLEQPMTALPTCTGNTVWDGNGCVSPSQPGSASPASKEGYKPPTYTPPAATTSSPPSSSIEGHYTLTGTGPDNVAYSGTADLQKIGGEMYNGVWHLGSTTFYGRGFRDGNVLSVGWSTKADEVGVYAYLVKADNSLDGVWFSGYQQKIGKEVLTGGTSSLSGLYFVSSGETPDKLAYSGTVLVSQTNGVYNFVYTLGTRIFNGIGVREGNVLAVGFSPTVSAAGVLAYRIEGNKLVGRWAQMGQKVQGLGSETMIKSY